MSNELKFTPAPWLLTEDGQTVYALTELGVNLWSFHVQGSTVHQGERRAVASMAKAAPDMYAELDAILDTYISAENAADFSKKFTRHSGRIRELLRSARGEV